MASPAGMRVPPNGGYHALLVEASRILVADLDDVIRSKQLAGRPRTFGCYRRSTDTSERAQGVIVRVAA